MCVNQSFEKAIFRKVMRVKGVRHKSQWIKYWIQYKKGRSKPMASTTKNGNNKRNDSKMCKTKPVLSEAWAELSPPQRKERSRRNEEELGGVGGEVGGGFQARLDEAKIRAKGKV